MSLHIELEIHRSTRSTEFVSEDAAFDSFKVLQQRSELRGFEESVHFEPINSAIF